MPVNYQLGKIYSVVNTENDIIYVGSTAKKLLASRMAGHRYEARQGVKHSPWLTAMRSIGIDKFKIVLLRAYPCNSKDELEAEEYRTIDGIIASGKQVYNDKKQGKPSAETKVKMSKSSFNFGSFIRVSGKYPCWVFQATVEGKKTPARSFSVGKYGEYGAHFRAEEARREAYPEWGNDEDVYCDDLGHIEWE